MKKTVCILHVGSPDTHGRVYRRHILEDVLMDLHSKTLGGHLVSHDDKLTYHSTPSHECHRLRIQGLQLLADVELLPTHHGKTLERSFPLAVFHLHGFLKFMEDGKTVDACRVMSINASLPPTVETPRPPAKQKARKN